MLQRERDTANAAATVDPLTGLLNRRGFQQTADALLEKPAHGYWSLALLDLDQFKTINDTFGHAAGDRVLVDFAEMLGHGLQERDMVCRLGGEEFAILFDANSPDDALAHCERLRAQFSDEPSVVEGEQIPHKVSIGLAIHNRARTDHISLERLMRRADEALYRAKRAGRNRVILCDEDDGSETDVVLELRLGSKSG
jgi:diguanylate cyclase (GGDEF)-like protein